jgi:hypothetical protein
MKKLRGGGSHAITGKWLWRRHSPLAIARGFDIVVSRRDDAARLRSGIDWEDRKGIHSR